MAKVKEITLSFGRRVSDGDYGSINVDYGETIVLEKGDDPDKEYKRLQKRVAGKMKVLAKKVFNQ